MQYQNILLIDDDTDDHEIFNIALKKVAGNLKFVSITSAREALNKLVSKELTPDIIFLDLNMPIMSGEEFLSEIKKRKLLQDIPVVILSTSSNPNAIKVTRGLGAVNFITKPNSLDNFTSALQSILQ